MRHVRQNDAACTHRSRSRPAVALMQRQNLVEERRGATGHDIPAAEKENAIWKWHIQRMTIYPPPSVEVEEDLLSIAYKYIFEDILYWDPSISFTQFGENQSSK